jgi:hypothetical protein
VVTFVLTVTIAHHKLITLCEGMDHDPGSAQSTIMTNAERQALAIYEMICATSGGRPLYGYSVEQMSREMADPWPQAHLGVQRQSGLGTLRHLVERSDL